LKAQKREEKDTGRQTNEAGHAHREGVSKGFQSGVTWKGADIGTKSCEPLTWLWLENLRRKQRLPTSGL